MAWRDEYQQGSFRGVTFRTQSHERRGGRRVAVNEMPRRDEPVIEDLGRRAREFAIECHVIGSDYTSWRDDLLDAVEAEGTGLLVHPWFGQMMVAVLDYTQHENTDDGGVGWFSLTLIEAGQPAPAPVAVSAGASGAAEADAALAAAPDAFAADFTIDGAAGWVEDAAGELISGMADASQIAAGLRGGVGPALRAFNVALNYLPGNLSSLMRAPLNLAHSVIGLVSAVSVLGNSSGRSTRLAPLEMMLDWVPSQPVFPQRTPQRVIEATNRMALLRLFRVASAAELVRAASTIEYASYDDARETRDAIGDRLDVLALAAADRGDDATAETYDALRRALAADIAAQGVSLARVYALELAETEPALVLAHRLYRTDRRTATSLEERAAGIADRNKVPHPGFLPGGVSLELLTAEATS
ncbi:DNA circularization protein [Novosphingobium naphthalenivorans]|uniref:DNA circularization protein n=1 Tax=Novosphingobium naphthalenivorans TaxID=273168 RepID=UPI000836F32F|nr:DNA circularization N-terminal domain-containing protein [Novosphingobium naphthalenivorans]